ncbi:hypothetical protein [Thalassospira sp.]|uniref:hypothetical protein n=1 Tax=Thalassospira sp. TaxID=1912094 RepID=UPI000C3663AC|nr:hypothetical protein [Thalassospira sp.]MAL41432.1 hypothetical protein [Thalassospira sp.]|tara:strand:+ start:4393 stop:4632 length:240 start_codon:yes stop_codon:yes gene_type:complete
MRKAVVDVEKCGRNGEYVALRSDPVFTGNEGTLTKEDIDTMAATLFKETSGPGYVHLTRADTKRIAAAMAVSIGLEVED